MRVFGVVWHLPLIVMATCFLGVLWGVPYAIEAIIWGSGELPGFLVMEFAVLFSAIGLAVTWALGLFSRRQRASLAGLGMRAFAGTLCAGLITYLISRMTSLGEMGGRTILLVTLVAALISSVVVAIVSRFIGDDIFRRKVLVFGSGVRARSIASLRRRSDRRGFKVFGYIQAHRRGSRSRSRAAGLASGFVARLRACAGSRRNRHRDGRPAAQFSGGRVARMSPGGHRHHRRRDLPRT